ncbi:hypothetical protein JCM3770_004255 [Rhodotorula araucariae]
MRVEELLYLCHGRLLTFFSSSVHYGVMALLTLIGGVTFWFNLMSLDREERSLNEIADGEHNAEVAFQKEREEAPAMAPTYGFSSFRV